MKKKKIQKGTKELNKSDYSQKHQKLLALHIRRKTQKTKAISLWNDFALLLLLFGCRSTWRKAHKYMKKKACFVLFLPPHNGTTFVFIYFCRINIWFTSNFASSLSSYCANFLKKINLHLYLMCLKIPLFQISIHLPHNSLSLPPFDYSITRPHNIISAWPIFKKQLIPSAYTLSMHLDNVTQMCGYWNHPHYHSQ